MHELRSLTWVIAVNAMVASAPTTHTLLARKLSRESHAVIWANLCSSGAKYFDAPGKLRAAKKLLALDITHFNDAHKDGRMVLIK